MLDLQLSEHFTLREMCASITADNHNIVNCPSPADIANLKMLCTQVLEPARRAWGRPLRITSGYRNTKLNKLVGGKSNSYHLCGRAADIHVDSKDDADKLAHYLLKSKYTDLVIYETLGLKKKWLHVQISAAPRNMYIYMHL